MLDLSDITHRFLGLCLFFFFNLFLFYSDWITSIDVLSRSWTFFWNLSSDINPIQWILLIFYFSVLIFSLVLFFPFLFWAEISFLFTCYVHIFLYLIKYNYNSSFKVLSDNFKIWVISGLPLFISWTLRMICWGDSEFCFSLKNVDFLVYFCRQFNLIRLKV